MKLLLEFIFFWLSTISESSPIWNDQNSITFLKKYGYLEEPSRSGSARLMSEDTVTKALKEFQRFTGLEQTGEMNGETIAMMNRPRCGVKDKVERNSKTRKKRYVLQGSKWRINRLTYRISRYPSKITDRDKVGEEIARAFKVWSAVTPLTFAERVRGRMEIDVRFEKGRHGDGDAFDGPGGSLAHAFFPSLGGDAHFDDEENWTVKGQTEKGETSLFQVAAHEFGHCLGLDHSENKDALMAPYYSNISNIKLHRDDIVAVQTLYGKGGTGISESEVDDNIVETSTDIPKSTEENEAADLCQESSIDTATRIKNGSAYVFKGSFYWKILEDGIADGYPRKISTDWGGLESNLDASVTWANGKTFFFKGNRYWKFINSEMQSGYPKPISSGFQGIPESLDAAFVWSGNEKTYFFKGDKYWKYESKKDPPVNPKYPLPISEWNNLPNNIDAALQWGNLKTYFFKGNEYYKFHDRNFTVSIEDPPYPRSTAIWWFSCKPINVHRKKELTRNGNRQD